MKTATRGLMLAAAMAATTTGVQAAHADYHAAYAVELEPPAPQAEVVPTQRAGYVWVRGHWEWRHGHWDWSPGYWEPMRERMAWVEGRWEKRGHHWHWLEGHWEEVATPPPAPAAPPPVAPFEVEYLPPSDPGEAVPAQRAGYVWLQGHWWWRGRWEWVPGRWEVERPGQVWVPGRWEPHGHGHRFHEGHWERH